MGWGLGLAREDAHTPIPTPPPPYPSGNLPPHTHPNHHRVMQGGGGDLMVLGYLGLSNATILAFVTALQGVVEAGVVSYLPFPYPATPVGNVAHIYLPHIHFTCGVAGDSNLPPIWDAVVQGRGKMEGLATLN